MVSWDSRQARLSLALFLTIVTAGLFKMYLTRPIYPDPALRGDPWPPAGCLVDISLLKDRALKTFPGGTTIASAVQILGLDVDPLGSGFSLPRAGVLQKGPDGWHVRPMAQVERWVWRIPMDVHRAGPDDLSRIDGIGQALGARIHRYVSEKKNLDSLEELLDVPGIGPLRLEVLKKDLALQ